MTTENPPQTTGTVISFSASAGQLQDTHRPPVDPETAGAIGLEVARISAHFRADLRPAQAELLTKDFIEDLGSYRIADIQAGFSRYRRNPENRFFPKPGQIIAEIEALLKDRRREERDTKRFDKRLPESRPLMWWMQSRQLWKPGWREADAPEGAMVRDEVSGNWRKARIFS